MGFGQSLPSARGRLLPVAAPSPDLLLSTAVAILAERRQYSGGGIRCAEKRLIALPAKQPRPARPFVGERATAAAQQCRLAQPRLSKFAAAVLAADDIALWQVIRPLRSGVAGTGCAATTLAPRAAQQHYLRDLQRYSVRATEERKRH